MKASALAVMQKDVKRVFLQQMKIVTRSTPEKVDIVWMTPEAG